MANGQGQDLFSPTQGLSQAPLFHQGDVERGGYGQPDPGSGIRGSASTVPWTIVIEPEPDESVSENISGVAQNAASPRRPATVEPTGTASMNPAAPMVDMDRAAPSVRRAANPRQWPMPSPNYQELLRSLTGRSVIADFLIGPGLQRRTGIITHVGTGYLVLRDPLTQARTGCDLLALRFLTVLPEDKKDGPASALRKFYRL